MVSNMRVWRQLLALGFRASPRWMAAGLAVAVIGALSLSCYAIGFQQLVDGYLQHDPRRVVGGAIITALLFSVGWTTGVLGANINFGLTERVGMYVTERLAEAVLGVPGIAHVEDEGYTRELNAVRENKALLAAGPRHLLGLLQVSLRAVGIAALLGYVYLPLAGLPLAAILPILADRAGGRVRSRAEQRFADDQRLAEVLVDLVSAVDNAPELRAYGLSDELIQRHDQLTSGVVSRVTRAELICLALSCLSWLLFAAAFIGGMAVVIVKTVGGQTSPGQLLMVAALVRRSQLLFSQVASTVSQLVAAIRTTRGYLWLRDYAAREARAREHVPLPGQIREGITLDEVTFGYPGRAPLMDRVTLHLPAGAVVAVVGDNGAGKSTIAKLLTRMYEPQSGAVRLDGVDIRGFDPRDWRHGLSATFQDFVRYELTVGHNVGIGDVARIADEDAVLGALERSGTTLDWPGLPAGLATPLGGSMPGGGALSGGQWQKLALARGLIRPRPLLRIFDEPGASLDPISEHLWFRGLAAQAREAGRECGAITVFISHRFGTVRSADLVIVMDNGRIAQVGSHDQLMEVTGRYSRLFNLQASVYS